MAHDYDTEYYRKREATARALAAGSSDADVARIHLQMAEEYARRAQRAAPPTLKVAAAR